MEVIKKFPEDMDARTEYKLVKTQTKKMSDAVDSVLDVKAWILTEENDSTTDEPKKVLTLETKDGEVFATISMVFMKEFIDIVKFFGDDVGMIKVIGRKSRSGRNYISCAVE